MTRNRAWRRKVARSHDVAIAVVALAGWRLEPFTVAVNATGIHNDGHDDEPLFAIRYQLLSPSGGMCGSYETRYRAAHAALKYGNEDMVGLAETPRKRKGRVYRSQGCSR